MDDVRELVACLSKVERGYTKMLNRAFIQAGYDLSREQYELLRVLWGEDNVNQQAISKKIQKDKYNVTKLLNTLSKRGFVQRKVCNEDKRNNFIVLTEKGVSVEKNLEKIEEQVHADLTFMVVHQDIKTCVWALEKLLNTLD